MPKSRSPSAYANALVAMDQATGTTLDRNGIQLDDALTGTVSDSADSALSPACRDAHPERGQMKHGAPRNLWDIGTGGRSCCSDCWCGGIQVQAQDQTPAQTNLQPLSAVAIDYTRAIKPFPFVYKPYRPRPVPQAAPVQRANVPLEVRDGKLRLSMAQLVAAVVQNNLTVASARYYPSMAQTDLLRARSGASPRGVDQSTIPSGVFAGAQGGSILGTAGGSGGGASNAGGITGAASQVVVRPSGVFDPSFRATFSIDHTTSPLNTLIVAGVPLVTNGTAAASFSYSQAFPSGTSIAWFLHRTTAEFNAVAPAVRSGLHTWLHGHRGPAVAQRIRL